MQKGKATRDALRCDAMRRQHQKSEIKRKTENEEKQARDGLRGKGGGKTDSHQLNNMTNTIFHLQLAFFDNFISFYYENALLYIMRWAECSTPPGWGVAVSSARASTRRNPTRLSAGQLKVI